MTFNFNYGSKVCNIKGGYYDKANVYLLSDPSDYKNRLTQPFDELDLEDDGGKFQLSVDKNGQRSIIYVVGPSGSGKSYFCANYIREWKKQTKGDVYIFCRTDISNDESYDSIDGQYIQIKIDENLVDNPIDIEHEINPKKKNLFLFDDCGCIMDKAIYDAVMKLIIECCEIGRKLGIEIVITHHLIISTKNREFSRTILNECHKLVVFPRGAMGYQQIKYALVQYFGYDQKSVQTLIKSNKSRWMCFNRHVVNYVLTESKLFVPEL